MNTFLVSVDGSDCALRAVDHAIVRLRDSKSGANIHLLNVQLPLNTVNIKILIDKKSVDSYLRDEGELILKPALHKLNVAGFNPETHIGVGDPAKVIIDFADSTKTTEIIMGTHGRGIMGSAFMGSIAQKVVHLSRVPVVLVK